MATIKVIKDENNKITGYQGIAYLGYLNGKQQKKKKTFSKRKDAQNWAQKIETDYKNQDLTSLNNNILYCDLLTDWFQFHSKEISLNTKNNIDSRLNNHILPKLGQYKVKDITSVILQNYYNSYLVQNLSINYSKKIMDIVNCSLKYAKTLNYIREIPKIKKLKETKTTFNVWTDKDITHFLSYYKDSYIYFPVFLTLNTGMRISELCGLRWCDVDWINGYINVRNQLINDRKNKILILTSTLKTLTSKRKIYLQKKFLDYLFNIKQQRNANNTDFLVLAIGSTNYKCNPNNLRAAFERAQKKLTKEDEKKNNKPLPYLRYHDLRHTHATLLLASGANIKAVSCRLGHDGVTETLNTYIHIIDSMQEDVTHKLSDIFDAFI